MENNIYFIYFLVAFIVAVYLGGIAFWIYLQCLDMTLSDYLLQKFREDHCEDDNGHVRLSSPWAHTRFTMDKHVDGRSFPKEGIVHTARGPFSINDSARGGRNFNEN